MGPLYHNTDTAHNGAAVPVWLTGAATIKPPPSRRELLDKVLPTALFSAVTMFTGNYAYLYLSVAFIQILKAFTPAMTMIMLVVMRIELWSGLIALSVLMIAAGTGLSALIESATPSFHLVGFISFMISAVTEAGRVVWFQVESTSQAESTGRGRIVALGGGSCPVYRPEALTTCGCDAASTVSLFGQHCAQWGLFFLSLSLSLIQCGLLTLPALYCAGGAGRPEVQCV